MGRIPCCSKKEELNKGAWTAQEDKILKDHIDAHGEGKWSSIARRTGLKRCGKSCRLRWLNYLRPDIKRGNITHDEEDLIIRLHRLLGNRWSLIAGRLPGRTDNEIKNYWNTNLAKRAPHPNSRQHPSNGAAEPTRISENPPAPVAAAPTRQNTNPLKTSAAIPTKAKAAAFTRSKSSTSLISNQTQPNAISSNPVLDHESSPLLASSGDELSPEYFINHHAAAENEIDSIISDVNINAGLFDFNDDDLEGGGDIDCPGTIIDGREIGDRSLFCDNNNEHPYLSSYDEMEQGFWGANVDFRSLTSLLESDHEEWSGGGDLDLYFQP